jgi:polyhydroxyalkanoate synthesis regulator phasin
MAAKAATQRAARSTQRGESWVSRIAELVPAPKAMEHFRARALKAAETMEQRLTSLSRNLRREGTQVVRDLEKRLRKEIVRLQHRGTALASPVQTQLRKAAESVRSRTRALQRTARHEAQRILVQQLEVAPRREVDQLKRRIDALEKTLARLSKEKPARTVPPQAAQAA